LSGYSGTALKTLGQCKLKCTYNKQSIVVEFFIVDTQSTPLLGMPSCLALELIKLIYTLNATKPPLDKDTVLSEFDDVFKGVGMFKGECSIRIDGDATPVVNPPRRVPVALRDKLQLELERMEKADVIAKVTEPTKWVNSLVIAEKTPNLFRSTGSEPRYSATALPIQNAGRHSSKIVWSPLLFKVRCSVRLLDDKTR
jgi:hypothetical protein